MPRLELQKLAMAGALCAAGVAPLPTAGAAEPPITAMAFSPTGAEVVSGSSSGLSVSRWPDLHPERSLRTNIANPHSLAFSPQGDRLAVAGGEPAEVGSLEILAWPDGKSLRVFDDHHDTIMAIAWIDQATIASAALDQHVHVYDTQSGNRVGDLQGHSRGVTSLGVLAGQNLLITAGIDQSLRVWNLASGELVRTLTMHTLPVHGIAVRPGEQALPLVASVGEDRTVRFWQPTIGRMVRFVRMESRPLDAQWLPDGSRLAVACTDGRVRVVDPDTVHVTWNVPAVDGWAYSLAVHPTDGTAVVGGFGGQIRRVDLGPP
jgi:WD40 repeat protein